MSRFALSDLRRLAHRLFGFDAARPRRVVQELEAPHRPGRDTSPALGDPAIALDATLLPNQLEPLPLVTKRRPDPLDVTLRPAALRPRRQVLLSLPRVDEGSR
ncbi:MAG: hypothetical protein H6722_07690 [Sandaracinus sp.]|nr:hypothetical protein [Sandaracinus sp.]MCB9612316.1 hypothetical protein [Sandaracinus sp.]